MRLLALGAAGAALGGCVSLVACGSDSDAPPATVAASANRPPTKAEFVEEVDAVCSKRNPEVRALGDEASDVAGKAESSSDLDEVADLYREVVSIVEIGEAELRVLTPPAADDQIYNDYLRSFSRQVTQVEALADALEAGDIERMESAADELETTDATSDGISKGYGFKVCGAD